MAKPEWGTKRVCQACAARFYDFSRSPITCPACGAVFDLEVASRARRNRPAPRAEPDEVGVPVADGDREETLAAEDADLEAADADEEEEDEEVAAPGVAADEDEDEDEEVVTVAEDPADEAEEERDPHLIEDTGDLGDDEEDVSDVVDEDVEEDPDRAR